MSSASSVDPQHSAGCPCAGHPDDDEAGDLSQQVAKLLAQPQAAPGSPRPKKPAAPSTPRAAALDPKLLHRGLGSAEWSMELAALFSSGFNPAATAAKPSRTLNTGFFTARSEAPLTSSSFQPGATVGEPETGAAQQGSSAQDAVVTARAAMHMAAGDAALAPPAEAAGTAGGGKAEVALLQAEATHLFTVAASSSGILLMDKMAPATDSAHPTYAAAVEPASTIVAAKIAAFSAVPRPVEVQKVKQRPLTVSVDQHLSFSS